MDSSIDFTSILQSPLFEIGNRPVTLGQTLLGIGIVIALLILFLIWRSARRSGELAMREAAALERSRAAEQRMAQLIENQNELTGRLAAMNENLAGRQQDLARAVNERLESMTGRIGQSISDTTKNTQESLAKLQERLAVIDTAQTNITSLTGQVVELQNILANKQTRGAFGEARMQMIVQDGLPMGAYAFQHTLSNSSRPDCVVFMPNDTPPLVVDAKFPLEAYNAIRNAETPERAKIAEQQFRRDVETHLKAIADKYFITGETQDTAFMFVPSESIFAEIHEKHEVLVKKAQRSRIVIVSPSLLMLSIQVIQSVLKDTRMREQAHLIQGEVIRLMEDVSRLDDRVRKLAGHFGQAQKDVEQILTSSDKVTRRGNRIADLEFEDPRQMEAGSQSERMAQPRLKAVE